MPLFSFILLGMLMFAFAGISVFFFLFDHRDKFYRFEDDDLINGKKLDIELKKIGGSGNEYAVVNINYDGGDTANLVYSSRSRRGARVRKRELTIPKETVDKLRDIYREYCIPILSDSPEREDIDPDAPTIILTYSSGTKSYTVSSEQELPEKNKDIFSNITKLLMSYVKK